MHRRLKSTLTVAHHFSIFAMMATGLIGLCEIGLAKADEMVTPWGEPNLQGIWTAEFDTPLQRSAKYANSLTLCHPWDNWRNRMCGLAPAGFCRAGFFLSWSIPLRHIATFRNLLARMEH